MVREGNSSLAAHLKWEEVFMEILLIVAKKRNGMIAENQVTFEYVHPNLQCSKDRDLSLVLVFPERDSGK